MSNKTVQFTDNKVASNQSGTYVTKTPFLIEDILYQHNQGGSKLNADNKLNNSNNNNNSDVNTKSSTNSGDALPSAHGNEEDYRKMLHNERYKCIINKV